MEPIPRFDQVQETFTAIFVLHFHYVDPVLRDFKATVPYLDPEGSPQVSAVLKHR